MKKKLEAELISIAHRILKMKNRSDIEQLHREASVLLEKLSVLRFVEVHLADARPTIGRQEVEQVIEDAYPDTSASDASSAKTSASASEPVKEIESTSQQEEGIESIPQQETEPAMEEKPVEKPEEKKDDHPAETPEENPEPAPEPPAPEIREPEVKEPEKLEAMETASHLNDAPEAEQIIAEAEPAAQEKPKLEDELFRPAFELSFERKEEPKKEEFKKEESKEGQIAFDDLLGTGYKDPVFVKPEDLAREAASHVPPTPVPEAIPITRREDKVPVYKMANSEIADRTVSLNDRLSKGITVGLNDRIAFVKHLFGNSNEDYNRVLSQLITFNTFEEASDFIENMVKPDYNDWQGKDEYATRFMEVVEKKFT